MDDRHPGRDVPDRSGCRICCDAAAGFRIGHDARRIPLGSRLKVTIALVTPVAFAASAGQGYLAPVGATLLFVALAQVIALIR